ncbi:MAG: AAA-associated domain-containing protein [Candidatus Micrarchaeota archaeon]|mgnify:CR=1 FL=1
MMILPDAGLSRVIGLLEVVHDHGNSHETVKLADELGLNLETLLPVIEAGEMLGFIDVAGGKIKLTDSGTGIVNGKILERKVAIKEKLASMEPFKRVMELLKSKKNGRMTKKSLQKVLRQELPKEQADKTASRIIEWGRHADLLGYNADSDELYLQVEPKKS